MEKVFVPPLNPGVWVVRRSIYIMNIGPGN